MKIHSIKYKITILYTSIVTLLFCVVLIASYASAKYYSENTIKTELMDEIHDFRQVVLFHPEYLEDTTHMTFFDDHILISIYDEDMHYLDGVIPDDLPSGTEFKDGVIQSFYDEGYSLYVYDTKVQLADQTFIWIRGAHTFNALSLVFQRLVLLSCILLPILILVTAIIGYRMINRSLRPVYTITNTVNEIIDSSDLSLRLERTDTKDEFYSLSETFNHLLEHMEQQFLSEKQFTSDAAHELRTPVSSILSRCEYCLDELTLSEEARLELLEIREKVLHMSSLITSLLEIARAENGQYQPDCEEVDLEILAESVIEELQEKASEKHISLSLENAANSAVILGDMEMLMRLFTNLVDNGISYGKEHGFVKIIIRSLNDTVSIEFIDNGIGIPKEHLEHIWNRFYQVDASHTSDNFGLGLFMVKYIVNCHNGQIAVESIEGAGSKFIVTLPVKQ